MGEELSSEACRPLPSMRGSCNRLGKVLLEGESESIQFQADGQVWREPTLILFLSFLLRFPPIPVYPNDLISYFISAYAVLRILPTPTYSSATTLSLCLAKADPLTQKTGGVLKEPASVIHQEARVSRCCWWAQ